MKKIINFSAYLLSVAVILFSCRKENNPKLPALIKFPMPVVLKVAGTHQVISAQNPSAFTGKFTVDMFFKSDKPAQQLDVVVIKNDNKSVVKLIQADVTTYPSEITITGTQLATLFGSPVVLGDKFDIGVDVTISNGLTYQAFPAIGNSYAAGVAAQPGASTSIRYEAVCQYEPAQYQGNFIVVTDEWGDYPPGAVVPLTMIDATHFSFKYAATDADPIVVTVNSITNAVTVAKQVYGTGYPPGWTFGDISVESVPNLNNFVAPCAGTFSVVLKHTVAAGSFGEYRIVLRKE